MKLKNERIELECAGHPEKRREQEGEGGGEEATGGERKTIRGARLRLSA